MRGRLAIVVVALAGVISAAPPSAAATGRPGIGPDGPWACPATHPIKGYLAQSGHRIYFLPSNPFSDEASPERCYQSEEEARRDGANPAHVPGWEKTYPLTHHALA